MASLPDLLNRALTKKGWSIAQLHRKVVAAGAEVSYHAVYQWVKRGGVNDAHKPALAAALDIPIGTIALASAARAAV